VTALKDDPRLFATIARYLLDANFEPSVHQDICEAVGLDLASLEDELENLVLICPNHHAAIHQVDAPFDFGELAFEFVRGERTWWERLQLNRHLPRAA
jgi:hypothetical protein